ncbi:MAG TPA: DNA gyrase C-terminal beta-propeller domain-containing protein [Bryobacteraceae bacterium]|nr:DNA gyrase C-terminal beta-propeller domain-containing protein [Bryobacteraceae bacterium]
MSGGKDCIFIATHEGMAIRFEESDVRPMGRPARGVRAMTLDDGDYVVAAEVVGEEDRMLSISENGLGKRTSIKEYRLTGRGGKGVINMKTTARVGKVMNVLSLTEDQDIAIITQNGKLIRIEAATVRQAARATQGVKLVDLEPGDRVAAASVIPDSANGRNGGDDNGGTPIQ